MRTKPKHYYMNRLPQQRPCPECKKTLIKPSVPMTQEGIDRLGGIEYAAKQVSRFLGYPVDIRLVETPVIEQVN